VLLFVTAGCGFCFGRSVNWCVIFFYSPLIYRVSCRVNQCLDQRVFCLEVVSVYIAIKQQIGCQEIFTKTLFYSEDDDVHVWLAALLR